MPPAAKKNAIAILFDVNSNSEFLKKARECVLNICAYRWFKSSKDCVKIILLNTAETNNSFAAKFGKCPHVVVATDVLNCDPKLVEPHLSDVETGNGDWLLGLAVALEEIKEHYFGVNGVMNIQLLFVSDFSHDVNPKEKQIRFVIDQLNHMNVFLYILGPEVKIPKLLATHQDIEKWSSTIEFVDNGNNANLPIIRDIISKSKGIVCGLEIGEELFNSYINCWGLQPWKVPLTIGSKLSLNCSTTRFLKKLAGPRIKAVTEKGYYEPWKWHMLEDINEEVPHENVIGGIFKHNKFVPLPDDVEKNFKFQGPRSFKIIGFTDSVNILEFYMQGDGASYVKNDGAQLFDLLLNILHEQNKVAIATKVYYANCKPKLVALLPQMDEQVFLLVELPYRDSINAVFKEQDLSQAIKLDPSEALAIDAVYNYLNQLDISEPNNHDESGSIKTPLSPELMYNMRLKVAYQRCLKKYLDNTAQITTHPDIVLPRFVNDVTTLKQFIPAVELDV